MWIFFDFINHKCVNKSNVETPEAEAAFQNMHFVSFSLMNSF